MSDIIAEEEPVLHDPVDENEGKEQWPEEDRIGKQNGGLGPDPLEAGQVKKTEQRVEQIPKESLEKKSSEEEDEYYRQRDEHYEGITSSLDKLRDSVEGLEKKFATFFHEQQQLDALPGGTTAVIAENVIRVDYTDERQRETLFFLQSPDKRIDFVLVYEDSKEDKIKKREIFEMNLEKEGLEIEREDVKDSVDGKSYFVKLHITWDAICTGAELMNMNKRIRMPKEVAEGGGGCVTACASPFEVGEPVITSEDDYFTAPFNNDSLEIKYGQEFDFDESNKNTFFTNAERSLIVQEILNRTAYSVPDQNSGEVRFGIHRLIRQGVYTASYPLHEGPYKTFESDKTPFEGQDKDRVRLYEAWARPGRWYCFQPIDLIRSYFGEKIAFYFAWLGFYTMMLIPPSIVGIAVFIYGIITMFTDVPSEDICDLNKMGNTTMCPQCDVRCNYWKLEESCIYSKITYVFDNYGTVFFAGFMAVWATFFLEFWKRTQKTLEYDWDVANFELEERMRPEFEFRVKHKKVNPITQAQEPFLPWYSYFPRKCASIGVVMLFILLVFAAIFGVILYRIVVVTLVYSLQFNYVQTYAKIITSLTASVVNLILILILNKIYQKIAEILTDLESPRTDTEYEDSFTFKMFLFQFVNFYGTIFYIAFFKGRFIGRPGSTEYHLFGQYRQDECDPSGCLVDLFMQLAVVMVGKQAINNIKELLMPKLCAWWRTKQSLKNETETNLYMRWEQDKDLAEQNKLGLFEEYLEMVIQYGFVTIFVAAFPLAPFFALLNNIVEIRLDAYKFVCVYRRTPAYKSQDIGVWYGILTGITFIAVLSNAFIIAYTSEFIPKLVYQYKNLVNNQPRGLGGYMDDRLSYFATADFEDSTKPAKPGLYNDTVLCRWPDFRHPPDVLAPYVKYEYTQTFWHVIAARLAFVIVFEHCVFLLTWLVSYIIPDVPSTVKQLMLYESALVRKARFDHTFHTEEDGSITRLKKTN